MTSRIVLAAAAVLLLAGCTPTPSPSPTSAPSSSATATSSPTPAGENQPLPTLPITCADLFSEQEVSSLLGTPLTVKVDETTVRNLEDAAVLQAGALSCTWGGESKTDNSWNEAVVVTILGNADADFDSGVWQVDDGAVVYPDGELSEYLCGTNGFYPCFANVLLDGYWAQVQAGSASVGDTQMRTIVDTLRAAITAAGPPRPKWTPPAGSLAGAYCGEQEPGHPATLSLVEFVASARAGIVRCQSDDGTSVTILPGGSWALPALEAYPDQPWWGALRLEPTAIAGTEAALGATTVWDGYFAIVSVEGSAISLSRDQVSAEQFIAEAPALITEIVAAG